MSMDLAYILRGYEISNTAKVIYGLLDGLSRASASNGLPYTYIGQRAIAERVGVCERTAHTAIKQLVSAGLIMVKRRGLTKTNPARARQAESRQCRWLQTEDFPRRQNHEASLPAHAKADRYW